MDHYDAFARIKFKNPKPYPRPWDKPQRLGSTSLSRDEAIALLRSARDGTLKEAG